MINIVASATETELGAIFVNCQRGTAMRVVLTEIGHAQPPTPEVTNSSTGYGFVNSNIYQ